ncbi:MAG: large conductance mechanosensitive channel protein MscL [Gemmatimonadales bacterium]
MWNDFKKFAVKGSVVDLAVGIIIGAAFTTIVKSLVDDIIMPPIGLLLGDVDFTDKFMLLKSGTEIPPPYGTLAAAKEAGAVTLNYGVFLSHLLTFLIVVFTVFLLVRSFQHLKERENAAPSAPTERNCPFCTSTISVKATRCPNCTSEVQAA